jgi:hypothetical protein
VVANNRKEIYIYIYIYILSSKKRKLEYNII